MVVRKSLIAGGIWMFVCFMVFASVGHFSLDVKTPSNTPAAGKAMVVFACLFITGFATTWSPQNYIPRDIERAQWRWAMASNWLWNSLIGFFTPFITQEIDFAYGYVFAGCLFVAVLTVYFFVIEGKDKTLEEMDMMYVMRVKPWESRKWTPPAPEHQVTTAQLSDERVAEDYGGEEETAINTKEAGPASA